MQIKKDYTREQIVAAAKGIFLKKGFSKTSMRDIAKGAGIGVSNIYNYYDSKDKLFRTILAPLITELEKTMYEHDNANNQEQFIQYLFGEGDMFIEKHVQFYLKFIINFHDELQLLLYKAQGSSLETYIDEYTEKCTQQVLSSMEDLKRKYPKFCVTHTPFTYHVQTVWMFSFISEVIKHQLKPQEIRDAIEDYIQFEFAGWRALMNKR